MRKLITKFAHCRSGAGALEFAFAVPVILVLVMGSVEFAIMSFAGTLLEGGLREAARFGISGLDPDDGTREQKIVEIVNSNAGGLFKINAADIKTLVYEDFSDIGQSEPFTDSNSNGSFDSGEPFTDRNCNGQWDLDMGVAGAGSGGEVVL